MQCGRKYTPVQKARGYDLETRKKAIQLYVDGMNLRRIGRHLGLHHRTVSLWVAAYAKGISQVPTPSEVETAELDELFTYIGDKKSKSTS
jgi:transposase